MKYILTILLMIAASQAQANDSTARVHLTKAKNNLLYSGLSTIVGSTMIYGGIINEDPTLTSMGYLASAIGVGFALSSAHHYNVANIEARIGYKNVGIRIRF